MKERCSFQQYDPFHILEQLRLCNENQARIASKPLLETQLLITIQTELRAGEYPHLPKPEDLTTAHIYDKEVCRDISWGDAINIYLVGESTSTPSITIIEREAGGNPVGSIFAYGTDKQIGSTVDGMVSIEAGYCKTAFSSCLLAHVIQYLLRCAPSRLSVAEERKQNMLVEQGAGCVYLWNGQTPTERSIALESILKQPSKACWNYLIDLFKIWKGKEDLTNLCSFCIKAFKSWPASYRDYDGWHFESNIASDLHHDPYLDCFATYNREPRHYNLQVTKAEQPNIWTRVISSLLQIKK